MAFQIEEANPHLVEVDGQAGDTVASGRVRKHLGGLGLDGNRGLTREEVEAFRPITAPRGTFWPPCSIRSTLWKRTGTATEGLPFAWFQGHAVLERGLRERSFPRAVFGHLASFGEPGEIG